MTRALVMLAGMVALASCAGPRPEIESVSVAPAAQPGRVAVTVTLHNRGGGDGQIDIDVTLRDRASGDVVGRDEFQAELGGHERIRVSREIVVPDGRDVAAEAEARYPPD